jgi:hypothetical protein
MSLPTTTADRLSTAVAYPARLKSILRAIGNDDPRAAFARPHALRFATIVLQLALVVATFVAFRLEEPPFIVMLVIITAGFAIHYWLPFAAKEPFLIALSLAAAFVLLDPVVALLLIATGFGIFSILSSALRYSVKVGIVVAAALALVIVRSAWSEMLPIPEAFWPVVAAVFMFRLVIYLYDLKNSSSRLSLKEYLSYFFIIPNYYFLLFPVIDFHTMRRSYFQRDIHDIAQTGVSWIIRGLIQLIIYRLVYHYRLAWSPETITGPISLIREMVLIYLLYLHVSGTFHIIVGILHLFGYSLPETHRSYLLASSVTDFWRRINIYWKDFMVKTVYFPVFFRLRKGGEARAQVIATGAVFVVTWVLHSYQFYWLSGKALFSETDVVFWAALGGLVVVSVLVERHQRRRRVDPSWGSRVRHGAQVAATLVLITVLWSLWNTPSLEEWGDILTWWQAG